MPSPKKKKADPKAPILKKGRPSTYTPEIGDQICSQISTSSKSLKTICKEEGMPDAATVMRWLRVNEDFRNQYARAKEEQADFLAEEILEIADDATNDFMTITKGDASYEAENKEWTSRSKLRVDSRKWIASKLKPKKYGEKLDMTSDGKALPQATVVITSEEIKRFGKELEDEV